MDSVGFYTSSISRRLSCVSPSIFPFTVMIILTHHPRLAVYGVVTAELMVCGVPSPAQLREVDSYKSRRFTEIIRSSRPARILGALAKLCLYCCCYPFLLSYWSPLRDGILVGVNERVEQTRRHQKKHKRGHKQKATLWNW